MALVTLRILRMSIIVLKEFTQPVQRLLANIARNNGVFRKYICNPPAQSYHWCEKSLLKLVGKDACEKFSPLTEEEAINLGSAIWAEIVVFLGCSKVVLLETNRQLKKRDGEEIIKNQEEDILKALQILQHRLDQQYIFMEKSIEALEKLGKPVQRPEIIHRDHEADRSLAEKLV